MNSAPLPPPAPFTPTEAAAHLRAVAANCQADAAREHAAGASSRRVSYTLRMAGYYAAGAAAIEGKPARPSCFGEPYAPQHAAEADCDNCPVSHGCAEARRDAELEKLLG